MVSFHTDGDFANRNMYEIAVGFKMFLVIGSVLTFAVVIGTIFYS